MDFITDLPACSGYNGIFTVVDHLTKYTKLIPISLGEGELSPATVARLFWAHVASVFGIPESIVHDRDPRFTGAFWREFHALLGTKTTFSSSHHP